MVCGREATRWCNQIMGIIKLENGFKVWHFQIGIPDGWPPSMLIPHSHHTFDKPG